MPVYKTKSFARTARRALIDDEALARAGEEIDAGRFDANLGGRLFKQRIAREGTGKSGGFRVLLAFHSGVRTVFLYAYAKKDRDNIDDDELKDWKMIAARWLAADSDSIAKSLENKTLIEVKGGDETKGGEARGIADAEGNS